MTIHNELANTPNKFDRAKFCPLVSGRGLNTEKNIFENSVKEPRAELCERLKASKTGSSVQ